MVPSRSGLSGYFIGKVWKGTNDLQKGRSKLTQSIEKKTKLRGLLTVTLRWQAEVVRRNKMLLQAAKARGKNVRVDLERRRKRTRRSALRENMVWCLVGARKESSRLVFRRKENLVSKARQALTKQGQAFVCKVGGK